MIVIDSSALISILLGEPEAEMMADKIALSSERYISSFSNLECSAVLLAKKGVQALQALQALYFRIRIQEVAFSSEQAIIAIDAYRRYGKGRHPAALNLGDCCSYALATSKKMPLLFKGNDFIHTDVEIA